MSAQTNIHKYAPAVLLSSKINVYKGDGTTNILLVRSPIQMPQTIYLLRAFQAILKNNRFDIPPGLENVPADWAKVTAVVQDALTQKRAKIKKAVSHSSLICFNSIISFQIRSSLKPKKDGGYAPDAEHLNIYELTVIVVKGTQCTVNVVLCSRVALMVCLQSRSSSQSLRSNLAQCLPQAPGQQVLGQVGRTSRTYPPGSRWRCQQDHKVRVLNLDS